VREVREGQLERERDGGQEREIIQRETVTWVVGQRERKREK
jgi:hypothetical protein